MKIIPTKTNIKDDNKQNRNIIWKIKSIINRIRPVNYRIILTILLISISINIFFIFSVKLTNIFSINKKINDKNDLSFLKNFYNNNNYLTNGRITAFAAADDVYLNFIPIYCAGLLFSDKRNRTDIEIATHLPKLPETTEKALEYLRKKYNNSKILIRYNSFEIKNRSAYLNGKKVRKNSIRFLIEPKIKNEYIFIGDIDIVYVVDNYYDNYLMDMFNRTSCYSNKVRTRTKRLTGVHFSKWYCLYPIKLDDNTNLMMNDEELLLTRLKALDIDIDYNTQYRPIFGIHMSVNRRYVENNRTNITWEAAGKRAMWEKFKETKAYKYIYPSLDKYVIKKINLLEEYYLTHE